MSSLIRAVCTTNLANCTQYSGKQMWRSTSSETETIALSQTLSFSIGYNRAAISPHAQQYIHCLALKPLEFTTKTTNISFRGKLNWKLCNIYKSFTLPCALLNFLFAPELA